ncbi:hypothetical protein ANN_10909 [Periplaneta americana]|uniref:Uncharacterized protein n=1 Tax=Periplaneta americana TaxID=6978 RepID=A0ABQ8T3J8_PERAM|nr:hypothetical protein ANN_10909 [Periplaneta americana]
MASLHRQHTYSTSLKAVLLHNGNLYPSIPVGHSVLLKEEYSNVKQVWVTVEPCIMCAAALHSLHVSAVTYGCKNDRFGGCTSVLDTSLLYSQPTAMQGGFESDRAMQLLKDFYKGTNPNAPQAKLKKTIQDTRPIHDTSSPDVAGIKRMNRRSSMDKEKTLIDLLQLSGTIYGMAVNKRVLEKIHNEKVAFIYSVCYDNPSSAISIRKKFLKRIFSVVLSAAAGYMKWDHKRNDDVMEELQLEPVINHVKHYQNCINHLHHRMCRDRIPKVMLHYRPNRKRSLGRPKKRWIENSTVRS